MGMETLDVYILFICRLTSLCVWVICLVRMSADFSLVYSCTLLINPFCYSVSVFLFLSIFIFFQRFRRYVFCKPHKNLLVHLGEPRGLKGLLHILNATAIHAKAS